MSVYAYGSCLKSGAKTIAGEWMQYFGFRQVAVEHANETGPAPAMTLAASTKLVKPTNANSGFGVLSVGGSIL